MTALKSCETCMEMNTATQRQAMGCGFEPAIADRGPLWRPEAFPAPLELDAKAWPSTCPGYTTQLPEVLEVSRARVHWNKGQLETFCAGDEPSEVLIMAIEILEGSASELHNAQVTPQSQGGLAKG